MNANPKRVIAGTTLGEDSDAVVLAAAGIAHALGARLHLVNAFETPLVGIGGPFEPVAYEIPPNAVEIESRNLDAMETQVARLKLRDLASLELEIADGPAHRVLADVIRREQPCLAVVGAADSWLVHALGSTASRLAHSTECPLLVLRSGFSLPPRRILMAVDMSPVSGRAVETGLDLLDAIAGRGDGASRHAPPAIEALSVVAPAGWGAFIPRFDIDGVKLRTREELDQFLKAHNPAGRSIESLAAFGGAREEILKHIEVSKPDLVVVGTHGRSGFERLMLGSVAEAILRSSPTSVLVVPPAEGDAAGAAGARTAA